MNKLTAFLLAPLLAGCLTSNQPEIVRWGIEFKPPETVDSAAVPSGNARLSLVTVRAPYHVDSITVLRADGTVAFDPYNEYATSPSILARGLVFDALTVSGIFAGVVNAGSALRTDRSVEVMVTRWALDCRTPGRRIAVADVLVRILNDKETSFFAATASGRADAADGRYGPALSAALSSAVMSALGKLR